MISMFHSPSVPQASVTASARFSHSAWKGGSSRLGNDGAEPHHPAEILRAVHDATCSGESASPVPIMLSRVTRLARRSSLQPSVPSGRIGRTR